MYDLFWFYSFSNLAVTDEKLLVYFNQPKIRTIQWQETENLKTKDLGS